MNHKRRRLRGLRHREGGRARQRQEDGCFLEMHIEHSLF
jgi:hypothetical protein